MGIEALTGPHRTLTTLEHDLIGLAAIVYAADLAVKRKEREDFVRSIQLDVPVVNFAAFNGSKQKIEQVLRVLSCDNWALNFVPANGTPEANRNWPDVGGTTLLFSGGLDSLAAACDLARAKQDFCLVSHVTHNHRVAGSQLSLVTELATHFKRRIDHLPVMVSCRQHRKASFPKDGDREETSENTLLSVRGFGRGRRALERIAKAPGHG